MKYELLGKDFTPPDLKAKVTGRAKYAEDFRVENMAFCKLLASPLPHARVTGIDASAALAMPGVYGVLTADDVPTFPAPQDAILTNEPVFVGQPILAVAAESEALAADALEKIKVTYEELPFTVDPLASLFPEGAEARTNGNVANPGVDLKSYKWAARDFAAAAEGQLPTGAPVTEWSYGDVDQGLKGAKLVLDESFVTAGLSHHSLEPRSALAYWQNGKCVLHASSQSQSFPVPGIARYLGIAPDDLAFVAEFCGGGFGSKGGAYPIVAVPAYFAKKISRPVMMRISRHEEFAIGSARAGFQGRIKIGFRADGRVTAIDLYIVQENGPNLGFTDWLSAAEAVSLVYQPIAMRFRGVPVLTNTPPRGPQRGPGQNQIAAAIEPLIDKAARQLGVDRVAIRKINAPDDSAKLGSLQGGVTSAHLRDALERGAERFGWQSRLARSGRRQGSKVTGIGVGTAFHPAGGNGFDGLVRLAPDGKLYIHTGVGNLGTYSHTVTSRVAAEVLKMSWERCAVVRGDSREHLPWNNGQFGSNTSFTMTRTNFAAATDAVAKLKEIAAHDLGGAPADYEVGGETRVQPLRPHEEAHVRRGRAARDRSRRQIRRPRDPGRPQRDDEGLGLGACGNRPDRRREGPAAAHGHGARARGGLHRNRARRRDGEVRDPRLPRRRGLRNRAASAGPRGADEERRDHGRRPCDARAAHLRPAERAAWRRRVAASETAVLPRLTGRDGDRRGRDRGPAEPGRREGHRRAGARLRGGGVARRDLRRARRALLQPHAGRY